MKRLSKIKLQNAVILEEQEMKCIFGGNGYYSSCQKNSESCSGECPDRVWYDTNGKEIGRDKQSCISQTGGESGSFCRCG